MAVVSQYFTTLRIATRGCAVGTIKSRVNRARTRLAELMHVHSAEDFGPDEQTRAVLAGGE